MSKLIPDISGVAETEASRLRSHMDCRVLARSEIWTVSCLFWRRWKSCSFESSVSFVSCCCWWWWCCWCCWCCCFGCSASDSAESFSLSVSSSLLSAVVGRGCGTGPPLLELLIWKSSLDRFRMFVILFHISRHPALSWNERARFTPRGCGSSSPPPPPLASLAAALISSSPTTATTHDDDRVSLIDGGDDKNGSHHVIMLSPCLWYVSWRRTRVSRSTSASTVSAALDSPSLVVVVGGSDGSSARMQRVGSPTSHTYPIDLLLQRGSPLLSP